LCDLPDGWEIAGGPRVFAIVAGGLAADAGGVGDEDGEEEGIGTPTRVVNGVTIFDLPDGSPRVTAAKIAELDAEQE